jgi:hypothetical protein
MATGMQNGDNFIKSNEDAHPIDDSKSGYGQNGFLGPSSDTKIGKTKSGFLPDPVAAINSQLNPTRVSGDPITAHAGMRNRNAESKTTIPANGRPVKK